MCSQCLYFTDKWIWQKNCVGKAIPQASQQFLPSFFTSIEERKGTERYTETSTWLSCDAHPFLFPYSRWIYAEICHCIIYTLMSVFICVRNGQKDRTEREKGRGCFYYLRVPLLFLCMADSFVCFTLYDLSVCWRLRVLCMKIKCALWQLCSLRKTDGLL